jgi:DNA-binding CsgD family transcriptional regulator
MPISLVTGGSRQSRPRALVKSPAGNAKDRRHAGSPSDGANGHTGCWPPNAALFRQLPSEDGCWLEHGAALDAFERIGIATLVVSGKGRIVYANSQAETLLRAGDAIRVRDGRLAIADRASSGRLASLIGEAADTDMVRGKMPGGGVSIPRGDRLPLTVLVAPFRPAQSCQGSACPAAILFVRDPGQSTLSSSVLQGLFGLTPAEAVIACALADGMSVDNIAATHGVSLNTARTHVRNALAKTGTRRQAELVALLLRSVASMAFK